MPTSDHEPRGGVCPECGKTEGYCNIGAQHWGSCDAHRIKWYIGSGLFSCWMDETEDDWHANAQRLESYTLRDALPKWVRNDEAAIRESASKNRIFLGRVAIQISQQLVKADRIWWRSMEDYLARMMPTGWSALIQRMDRQSTAAAMGSGLITEDEAVGAEHCTGFVMMREGKERRVRVLICEDCDYSTRYSSQLFAHWIVNEIAPPDISAEQYDRLSRIAKMLDPFGAKVWLDNGELTVTTNLTPPCDVLQELNAAWTDLERTCLLLEIQRRTPEQAF